MACYRRSFNRFATTKQSNGLVLRSFEAAVCRGSFLGLDLVGWQFDGAEATKVGDPICVAACCVVCPYSHKSRKGGKTQFFLWGDAFYYRAKATTNSRRYLFLFRAASED